MVDPTGWLRQGQERYLRSTHLDRTPYHTPRAKWDHDHCEFCWAKVMGQDAPDVLRAGNSTPGRYRWICAACARDFAEELGFVFVNLPEH